MSRPDQVSPHFTSVHSFSTIKTEKIMRRCPRHANHSAHNAKKKMPDRASVRINRTDGKTLYRTHFRLENRATTY